MFASRVVPLRRTFVAFLALLLVACGGEGERSKPREAWRNKAEAACLQAGLIAPSAFIVRRPTLNGPGNCGAKRPFTVSAALGGQVAIAPAAILACPMIPQLDRWLAEDVQPMAYTMLGEPVTALEVAGGYSCRTINSKRGAKMSEHAYANALDVIAFRFPSGRRVSMERSWQGSLEEAVFLREAHLTACRHFRTVIGPDGDSYHLDNLHLDLAWRGKDGLDVYCE
jgi:hypothetical protein